MAATADRPSPGSGTTGAAAAGTIAVAGPTPNGPGGVGPDPLRTGLPATPAGGRVRTGPGAAGCFTTVGGYLDQWNRTGLEPEPCFQRQPASAQPQPASVARTYNGQRF